MKKTLNLSLNLDGTLLVGLGLLAYCFFLHPLALFFSLYLLWGVWMIKVGRKDGINMNQPYIIACLIMPWLVLIVGYLVSESFEKIINDDVSPLFSNKFYTLQFPIVFHPHETKPEVSDNEEIRPGD